MAFISNYVMQKEFFLPDLLRKAISDINYQIETRRKPPALAVHIVNNIYKSMHNIEYGKEFLWEKYRARKAYIGNGLREYKKWAIEMRTNASTPIQEKLCECGCGEPVENPKNRFINGHNIRLRSDEEKQYYTEKMLKDRRRKKAKIINVDFKAT